MTTTDTREVEIEFHGIDSWNRPVFKEVGAKRFYGSTCILFDFDDSDKKVEDTFEGQEEALYYFGKHFDCEPMGIHPSKFQTPFKLKLRRTTNGKEDSANS